MPTSTKDEEEEDDDDDDVKFPASSYEAYDEIINDDDKEWVEQLAAIHDHDYGGHESDYSNDDDGFSELEETAITELMARETTYSSPQVDNASPPSESTLVEEQPSTPTRRRKPIKSRGTPKRPLSAYNLFFQRERILILKERKDVVPRIGFQELGKIIGERWQLLPSAERAKYQKISDYDITRYRREMDLYEHERRQKIRQTCRLNVPCSPTKPVVGSKTSSKNDFNDLRSKVPKQETMISNAKSISKHNTSVEEKLLPSNSRKKPPPKQSSSETFQNPNLAETSGTTLSPFSNKAVKPEIAIEARAESHRTTATVRRASLPSSVETFRLQQSKYDANYTKSWGCMEYQVGYPPPRPIFGSEQLGTSSQQQRQRQHFQSAYNMSDDPWKLPSPVIEQFKQYPSYIVKPYIWPPTRSMGSGLETSPTTYTSMTNELRMLGDHRPRLQAHSWPTAERLSDLEITPSIPRSADEGIEIPRKDRKRDRSENKHKDPVAKKNSGDTEIRFAPISFLEDVTRELPVAATVVSPSDAPLTAVSSGMQVLVQDSSGIEQRYNVEYKYYKLSKRDADAYVKKLQRLHSEKMKSTEQDVPPDERSKRSNSL